MPLFIFILFSLMPMPSVADSNLELIEKFTKLNIPVLNIIRIKLTKIAATMDQQYKTSHDGNINTSVVDMINGVALNTTIKVASHQVSTAMCAEFLKKMMDKLSSQRLAYMIFPYSPYAFRNEIRWLISHKVVLISQIDADLRINCI